MANSYGPRMARKKGRGIKTNVDGSKTMVGGKKGKNAKATTVWWPKNRKKGKVLVTVKRWVTPKQAKQYTK